MGETGEKGGWDQSGWEEEKLLTGWGSSSVTLRAPGPSQYGTLSPGNVQFPGGRPDLGRLFALARPQFTPLQVESLIPSS